MTNFLSFFTKHKYLSVLILFIAAVVFFIFYLGSKRPPVTQPNQINFESITPGKSTTSDVNKVLGTPISQTQVNGYDLSDYKSTSPTRNNQVYYTNGTAQLIKEIVSFKDLKKVSDVTKKYGTPTNILYGPDTVSGFYLFVYLDKGIAYLGNPNTGDLLEIWYFSPMSLDNFISTWAQDYSKNPPAPIQ